MYLCYCNEKDLDRSTPRVSSGFTSYSLRTVGCWKILDHHALPSSSFLKDLDDPHIHHEAFLTVLLHIFIFFLVLTLQGADACVSLGPLLTLCLV